MYSAPMCILFIVLMVAMGYWNIQTIKASNSDTARLVVGLVGFGFSIAAIIIWSHNLWLAL